jgi:hypothetical protein
MGEKPEPEAERRRAARCRSADGHGFRRSARSMVEGSSVEVFHDTDQILS